MFSKKTNLVVVCIQQDGQKIFENTKHLSKEESNMIVLIVTMKRVNMDVCKNIYP